MKKLSLISSIIYLFCLNAYSQQEAGFSMYFFNPVFINPAYAGSREVLSGSLVHRSQWTKMTGAPQTQSLSVHSALPYSRIGLGLQVYNDKIGPSRNTGVNATFAYHLPLSTKTKLSFGLTGMMNNMSVGWDEINVDDNNDLAFTSNTTSAWVPDASAGLYLYRSRFYLGLSGIHLMQSKFGFTNADGADLAKFSRQYYLTSGVVIPVTRKVDIRPSILVKYVKAAPAVGEINASFIFFQRFHIGPGFRSSKRINLAGTDNMIIGFMQFQLTPSIGFGYSYDYYLNQTGAFNSGTHEFMLGWDISGIKTKMSAPRFF